MLNITGWLLIIMIVDEFIRLCICFITEELSLTFAVDLCRHHGWRRPLPSYPKPGKLH